MRKFLFAMLIALVAGANGAAAQTALEDMLGRWCVDNGNLNVFTMNSLTVTFPNGQTRVLRILKVQPQGNELDIWWGGDGMRPDSSTGYEISADKRTLYQLPNTTGDMGPRRVLTRC